MTSSRHPNETRMTATVRDKQKISRELVPETFGLINEYYTPTLVADSIAALCPMLPELAGNLGDLEPSVGIGRLLRAFSPLRGIRQAGGLGLVVSNPPYGELHEGPREPHRRRFAAQNRRRLVRGRWT